LEIVGTKIGRYDILEHIGEGGMAHVYRAFDPEINRTVAAKILKEEHCEDAERQSRFIKEGKAAGALAHPNIVTVYDVGQINDVPYIMMELLEGRTLGDILQAQEQLSLEAIMQIGIQLGSALDYAHEKGVVHRDMKPDNIILSSDGVSAKVADFGIARMQISGDEETTQVGLMLGTPRYMSPEQATGDPVDGRSDLFAVGVILYEMITGKKAFDADTMPALIMQIINRDPLPIRQINSEAPIGLQKIVKKLLQKKPARRFQSGRELSEALERELLALRDTQEEKAGYLPLQVKWTAIMSALVAVAMAISATLVFQAQSKALTQQAIDGGISLSKFVAVQAAIPVLSEDWVTLDSFVQDAVARESFRYLVVSDHEKIVRVSSDASLVGKARPAGEGSEVIFQQDSIEVLDAGGVFDFSLPILFNETIVGGVNVGLDTGQLDAALATTQRMMAFLVVAVVLAVAVALFLFNKLIAKNILLATRAIKMFGNGQLETRISKQRADEIGELFKSFNTMADSLEDRVDTDAMPNAEENRLLSDTQLTEIDVSGITQSVAGDQTIVSNAQDGVGDHTIVSFDHDDSNDQTIVSSGQDDSLDQTIVSNTQDDSDGQTIVSSGHYDSEDKTIV
jgi:tRNA A-37 threonylcarbamoyl transferase component Bud32/HAMP domain-containing protein